VKLRPRVDLDRFFDGYLATARLAQKLIEGKSNAQDVLILICARLDALSCSWVRGEEPGCYPGSERRD
jgi:hypothetical protein